ncbi:MAG: 3-hydroxyacyl-CoA dehydrogenase [Pseudomonadota bacterium]
MFSSSSLIGVCGAGAMGAGIAQVAAAAGHVVFVLDRDAAALDRGRAAVAKGAAALLKRGKIDATEADALHSRITWTTSSKDFASVDLVVEAIVEKSDVKTALFQDLEEIVGEGAVLATNTSSLSVTRLAADLKRPQRFLGLHFFNPAPVMKLVEVVSGAATDPEIAAAAFALMESWGKIPVHARDVPGFIVNRVARPFYGEGWRALDEGAADAATLDYLYRALAGFRMGPLELGDLIGHDINFEAAQSVFHAYFGRTRFAPSLAQGALVAAGRLGRKTGRGVYAHGADAAMDEPKFLSVSGSSSLSVPIGSEAPELKALLSAAGVSAGEDAALGDRLDIDGVGVAFSNGHTAAARAAAAGRPFAVIDWMRDPAAAEVIAFAASDEKAREAALALAALVRKKAVEVSDRPGLVVFRTLAQLANCAADAVRDKVADAEAIDKAMRYGVNYPFGPMGWAETFGASRLAAALDRIADATGESMYRPNEVLRRLATNDL